MHYRTTSGRTFTADSFDDLIEAMWHGDPAAPPTQEEWMQQNADHAAQWDGAALRVDTPEHHAQDMLRYGLLLQVDEGGEAWLPPVREQDGHE